MPNLSEEIVSFIVILNDIASVMNQSTTKSPHKSLAIKGPPKVINEQLDIDNYQGVKVMDINVRPLNQSVA